MVAPFRTYGRHTEIINRGSEVSTEFVTCIVMRRAIELDKISDLSMACRIAREMARMHTIHLSGEDIKQPLLYSVFFTNWINEIPETLDTDHERTARCTCVCIHICCMWRFSEYLTNRSIINLYDGEVLYYC